MQINRKIKIMTKEERIKEAYGEYYEGIKNQISDEGWINENVISRVFFSDLEFHDLTNSMRPLSLQGIEDNNGWIKIESESDFPKENCAVWAMLENGKLYLQRFMFEYGDFSVHTYKYITHYKIIQEPEPPIY